MPIECLVTVTVPAGSTPGVMAVIRATSPVLKVKLLPTMDAAIEHVEGDGEKQTPFPTCNPVIDASESVVAAAVAGAVKVANGPPGIGAPGAGMANRKFAPAMAPSCVVLIGTAASTGEDWMFQV